ncbi:MAG: hypothetical protein H8E94_02970 [Alphaproteobacteria bacterium]|nr:hypothetical protein [Alphaproteobacteria bacterium]
MMKKKRAVSDNLGPTPETAAKLRYDVIDTLHRAGELKLHHVNAAHEIERVYLALCRGMFPASRPDQNNGSRRITDIFDRLTDAEESLWLRRYKPWANKVGRAAQIVFDAKVNNLMQPRELHEPLRAALQVYAEIAGYSSKRAA